MAKNIIFYGPPGTGKTFYMQSLMGNYMDFSIDDQRIQDIYTTECSEDWLLIALVLLQNNDPMQADEISDKITSLDIDRTVSPTDVLEQHSVEDSPIGAPRHLPRIFEQYGQEWYVNRMSLLSYDKDFFNNYVGTDAIAKRYQFVTFHQSYSYEDFIEGIRPSYVAATNSLDYSPKDGVFKTVCKMAEANPTKDYALFIDEINRGNISEIFGELISLIEINKRKGEACELETILPYSRELFSVPKNLDIYGTMNSADKSIAAIDIALRRRFKFQPFPSNGDIIKETLSQKGIDATNIEGVDIIQMFNAINKRIELLLDENHVIGHAYFLDVENLQDLIDVIRFQVVPVLEEYFFDDLQKIQLVFNDIDEDGELRNNAIYLSNELDPDKWFSYLGDYEMEPKQHFGINPSIKADSLTKIYS